ncbi:MAG: hypothetical protein WCR52_23140 [Bacteroidota bacterium]
MRYSLLVQLRLFIAFLMLACSGILHAQQNQKTVFTNPGDFKTDTTNTLPTILNTPDNGWLLCSYLIKSGPSTARDLPRLVKINAAGQTEWDQTYLQPTQTGGYYYLEPLSILNAPDGGYMMSYRDDSTHKELLKIGNDGAVQWQKDIGYTPFGINLLGVVGNEYYGYHETYVNGNNTLKLFRLDLNGNVLSSVVLTVPWTVYGYFQAVMTENNEIQVYWQKIGGSMVYLVRYDLSGNMLWQSQPANAGGASLFKGPENGFTLINANGLITRFDATGASLDVFDALSIPNVKTANKVVYYPDGAFMISGQTTTKRGYLAKIAANHNVIWVSEAPEDGQAGVSNIWGATNTDGWAAGVGIANGMKSAFVRIFENTGITVKTLTGVVRRDFDNDCVPDAGTPGLNGTQITAHSAAGDFLTAFSGPNGTYTLLLPPGVFTLNANPANQFFFQCPAMADTAVDLTTANTATVDFAIQSLQVIHNIIGKVVVDENDDCTQDAGDTPVKQWAVTAQGSGFKVTTLTYNDGTYSIFMPNGAYDVSVETLNPNFIVCSPAVQNITLAGTTGQTATADFTVSKAFDCGLMKTWIDAGWVRPCTTTVFSVHYQNQGTADEANVKLTVNLDPLLTYVSSSLTPTSINGNTLVFEIGTVSPTTYMNSINISAKPDCNMTADQQVCLSAEIEPYSPCFNAPGWSGAIITVNGTCNPSQTQATFTFKNVGNAASQSLDYVIVEDQIVLLNGNLQLAPGASESHTVPINGMTLTGAAQQEPGFPGDTTVNYSIVNCVGMAGGGSGFNGNPGPFIAQSCFPIHVSFDPNDKDARPLGFGPEHIVLPGMPLDYTVRFQNTGNDTAFLVVVRDTLSSDLDPSTFMMRYSSFPCRVDLLGGNILQFTFEQIQLPDSTTNKEGSQGYLTFSIHPRGDLPLGTVVGNSAAIYFDYNKPVITNTVYRKIDRYFTITAVQDAEHTVPVQVFPNPALQAALLTLPETYAGQSLQFELQDGMGRLIQSVDFTGNTYHFERGALSSGMYFWKMRGANGIVAAGKLMMQ